MNPRNSTLNPMPKTLTPGATWQVATLDGWGKIVRAHGMREDSTAYFSSFILVVAFTLFPVVVAVLLERFADVCADICP